MLPEGLDQGCTLPRQLARKSVNAIERGFKLSPQTPDDSLLCRLEDVEGFCSDGRYPSEPHQQLSSLEQISSSLNADPLAKLVKVRLLPLLEPLTCVRRPEVVTLPPRSR